MPAHYAEHGSIETTSAPLALLQTPIVLILRRRQSPQDTGHGTDRDNH